MNKFTGLLLFVAVVMVACASNQQADAELRTRIRWVGVGDVLLAPDLGPRYKPESKSLSFTDDEQVTSSQLVQPILNNEWDRRTATIPFDQRIRPLGKVTNSESKSVTLYFDPAAPASTGLCTLEQDGTVTEIGVFRLTADAKVGTLVAYYQPPADSSHPTGTCDGGAMAAFPYDMTGV